MAERFYGLDRGKTQKDVTEGSSSTATTDVEIRIDLAGFAGKASDKIEVLNLIEHIKNAITRDTWPPA